MYRVWMSTWFLVFSRFWSFQQRRYVKTNLSIGLLHTTDSEGMDCLAPLSNNNATRVTHFNVTFLRLSSSLGPRVFMKSRTVDRFQMLLYLGRVGLDSNTPFISLVTKGWFPNVFLFGSSITVERVHLAVFKELYVNPLLYCVTKKSIPFVVVPQRGLTFLEVQNNFHLSR